MGRDGRDYITGPVSRFRRASAMEMSGIVRFVADRCLLLSALYSQVELALTAGRVCCDYARMPGCVIGACYARSRWLFLHWCRRELSRARRIWLTVTNGTEDDSYGESDSRSNHCEAHSVDPFLFRKTIIFSCNGYNIVLQVFFCTMNVLFFLKDLRDFKIL